MLVGCAVMTPLVLWFATLPDVRSYYASSVEPLPGLLLTNALDLSSGEFLFRGFLTFTLLRAIGPLGVVVATMPVRVRPPGQARARARTRRLRAG